MPILLSLIHSAIDAFTGKAVVIDTLAVDYLTSEEANDLVALMNLQDLLHRKGLESD